MCNYPRLYCTNGENVPDLLNGQQRLNPVRADSVTMVITVAFLVLAPFFFYIYIEPPEVRIEQWEELFHCYYRDLVSFRFNSRFDRFCLLLLSENSK